MRRRCACIDGVVRGRRRLRIFNQAGDFSEKKDIRIQIHIPDGFSTDGKSLKIVSPEFEDETNVEFQSSEGVITFTVPSLHIWEVGILE